MRTGFEATTCSGGDEWMESTRIIARNSTFMIASEVIVKVSFIAFTMICAQHLGVEHFGIIGFALAFIEYFVFFMDFGINFLVVRDVSKDKSLAGKYLGNMFVLKVVLSAITTCVVLLIVSLLQLSDVHKNVLFVIAFAYIFAIFFNVQYSIFQAYELIKFQSLGNVLNALVLTGGSIIAALAGLDVVGFAFLYLVSYTILFTYCSVVLWKYFPTMDFKVDVAFWKESIKNGLPFGIIRYLNIIYRLTGILLITFLVNDYQTGMFNAAMRIENLITQFTGLFLLSSFPTLNRLFHAGQAKDLAKIVKTIGQLLFILSVITVYAVIFFSDLIIMVFFGMDFQESTGLLSVVIWGVIMVNVNGLLSYMLIIARKERKVMGSVATGAIVNFIACIWLIPLMGAQGAAIALVLVEGIILGLYHHFIDKTFSFHLPRFVLATLASVTMFVAVVLLASFLHPVISFLACVATFLMFTFITHAMTRVEFKEIITMAIRILKRNQPIEHHSIHGGDHNDEKISRE